VDGAGSFRLLLRFIHGIVLVRLFFEFSILVLVRVRQQYPALLDLYL